MIAGTFNFMGFRNYEVWNKSNHLATLVMQSNFCIINIQLKDLFPDIKIKLQNFRKYAC